MPVDLPERPADELRHRDAVPAPRHEIHHRRLEPVAAGEPLVLGGQHAVVRRQLLARGRALAVELHERLAVRGERDGVVELGDRVADADLDRSEPRMRPHVPPDVRVVGDAARLLQVADDLRVLEVVVEARRHPGARERRKDHLSARGETRRLTAPEGRVAREREQLAEVGQQGVHDLDRAVGIFDRDVDVHPEDQLAPRDVLELVD